MKNKNLTVIREKITVKVCVGGGQVRWRVRHKEKKPRIYNLGLFLTAFLLEKIGRKYTMAIEFGIFSLFVFLVNICTTR